MVHEPCHHHAMPLDAHTPCPHIGVEEPRSVGSRTLSARYLAESQSLEEQCIVVAKHTCHRRIARHLVVEKQTPVVAVGHGLLAVGKRQPVKYVSLHGPAIVEHPPRVGVDEAPVPACGGVSGF